MYRIQIIGWVSAILTLSFVFADLVFLAFISFWRNVELAYCRLVRLPVSDHNKLSSQSQRESCQGKVHFISLGWAISWKVGPFLLALKLRELVLEFHASWSLVNKMMITWVLFLRYWICTSLVGYSLIIFPLSLFLIISLVKSSHESLSSTIFPSKVQVLHPREASSYLFLAACHVGTDLDFHQLATSPTA
jgi:hypothetical protein